MHSIHAVLFDFGKVLSLPPNAQAWEKIKAIGALSEQTLQRDYWKYRDDYDEGLLTGDDYWRRIAGEHASAETLQALKAADVALWTEMNQPMLDWVASLHRAGFRTGILSNMPDAMAEGICAQFDWIGNFDHVVWSHAWKMRKPRREIYAVAAEGLKTPAEEILFLDDKEDNIAAAQAFGMEVLLYSNHEQFLLEMKRRGWGDLLEAGGTVRV